MTKKKAIMYGIIFIVLFCASLIFRTIVLYNPSENFNDMCKNVFAPSCQVYVGQLLKDKKYDEAAMIQKEKIRQSKQILNVYKRKTTDKCLYKMTAKEADESLMSCIGKPKGKTDYYLLKTSTAVVQDIVMDSVALAQIQSDEQEDTVAAYRTLKSAKKMLKDNPYVPNQKEAIEYLEKLISNLD